MTLFQGPLCLPNEQMTSLGDTDASCPSLEELSSENSLKFFYLSGKCRLGDVTTRGSASKVAFFRNRVMLVVARDGFVEHYTGLPVPANGIVLNPKIPGATV